MSYLLITVIEAKLQEKFFVEAQILKQTKKALLSLKIPLGL